MILNNFEFNIKDTTVTFQVLHPSKSHYIYTYDKGIRVRLS